MSNMICNTDITNTLLMEMRWIKLVLTFSATHFGITIYEKNEYNRGKLMTININGNHLLQEGG